MAKARSRNAASSSSNSSMNIGEYGDKDGNDKRDRGQLKWKVARCIRFLQQSLGVATSTTFSFVALALIAASVYPSSGHEELQSTLMRIGTGYLLVAKPLLSTLAVSCDIDLGGSPDVDPRSPSRGRGKGGASAMTRVIAFSFLTSIVCTQLPKWFSALVGCLALFAFGLASRQLAPETTSSTKSASNHAQQIADSDGLTSIQRLWSRLGLRERAALAGIALVVSMLTENFVVWVVSATYQPGIDGSPEPLQDNGRIVLERLAMKVFHVKAPWMAKRVLQKLRDGLNVQWALVSSFGASLVCLELQLDRASNRSLAGVALHGLMTLATARLIRTISFALTVLPSQVPNCYASHFPPPPEAWKDWLMVGFLPNTRGGCNDLILSGHATVTSTLGCAFTSVASNASFSIAVWTLIALDYSIEAYQGLHYSVDMWLGGIVTCLLWHLLKPLETGGEHGQANSSSKKEDSIGQPPLDTTTVGMYALPAVMAFVALTMVPEAYINYFLVIYSSWAVAIFVRCGVTNYMQHVLLCELCFGLAAYL